MAMGYVLFLKVEIVGGDYRSVWVCWKFREKSGRSDKTFYCSVVQHSQLITIQASVASKRCRLEVKLDDTTGHLMATLFGDEAENFLSCSAIKLMKETTKDGIKNIESFVKLSTDKNFLIQVKAIKLDTPAELRYKFNIVAIHDPPQENP